MLNFLYGNLQMYHFVNIIIVINLVGQKINVLFLFFNILLMLFDRQN